MEKNQWRHDLIYKIERQKLEFFVFMEWTNKTLDKRNLLEGVGRLVDPVSVILRPIPSPMTISWARHNLGAN